jgi:hypothetical protein
MAPRDEQQPLGANLFVLNGPLNAFEREALMRFESWSWRERWGWRIRYTWARLRGKVGR